MCFIFVLSQLFFVFLGQLISDDITEVISRYNKEFFTPYGNQLTTKSAGAQYDDSYLGKFCFDVVLWWCTVTWKSGVELAVILGYICNECLGVLS